MAKRKAGRAQTGRRPQQKAKAAKRSAKRPTLKLKGRTPKKATKRRVTPRSRRAEERPLPTPPSSLNMNRRGSAARTGRAEMKGSMEQHRGMGRISGGDIDVDLDQAYFTGDEAPGGDNPTPDQEVVDEIGEAIGVEYQDNEELGTTEKVSKRDKHRWELDPASAEDYKDRR
jgi:Family of unknown function (DUF6335)